MCLNSYVIVSHHFLNTNTYYIYIYFIYIHTHTHTHFIFVKEAVDLNTKLRKLLQRLLRIIEEINCEIREDLIEKY